MRKDARCVTTKRVKEIPNLLTYLRLVLIPVFVFLMVDPTPAMRFGALAVFLLAAITDYFDGILARKFSAVSDLGKLLDPLADKILVMAALVMLLAQRSDLYGDPWVPGWMVVLVLAREIWVTGLRSLAASQGVIVEASTAGKAKSFLQMVAITFLILHEVKFSVLGAVITCQLIGLYLLLVSIALSLWGAIEYTVEILGGYKRLSSPSLEGGSAAPPPAQGAAGEKSQPSPFEIN